MKLQTSGTKIQKLYRVKKKGMVKCQEKSHLKKMSEKLDKVEKKRAKRQTEMESIDKEYKELSEAVASEKKRIRTDRLVKIGEVVCKHFGENITYSEFDETINALMLISEVQDFILSEKAKCKDNSQNEKNVCG